jgi:hypothetical protein
VWRLLTNFASYPQWNPFIRSISGQHAPRERLQAHIEPPGGRGMTFKPKVLNAEPNRELRWLGHLLVPGLFDGEHSFTIQPLETILFVSSSEKRSRVCWSLCLPIASSPTRSGGLRR